MKDQIIELLKKENLWAKKSLGQNFLIDPKALNSIVESAEIDPEDHVIEVGPGTGVLTENLLEKAKKVTAIEFDEDMIQLIEKRFSNLKKLKLIQSDILKLNLNEVVSENEKYKVVANIPYYITSPIIKYFLQAKRKPELIILLVQKEVAEKICGIKDTGLITMETKLFAETEIIANVPSESFYPAPKVDSAILKLKVRSKPIIEEEKIKTFVRLLKFGFSQKRKKLTNNLSAALRMKTSEIRDLLSKLDLDENSRAEHLKMEDWKPLFEHLVEKGNLTL